MDELLLREGRVSGGGGSVRAGGLRDAADEENGGEREIGEDAFDELEGEGSEGADLRMMTMSPSEWAEKMASTTSSSGAAHPRRSDALPSGRSRVSSRMMSRVAGRESGDDLVLLACARPFGCRRDTGWRSSVVLLVVRQRQDARRKVDTGIKTHLESRPLTMSENLPYPNPPSLGCPRSLTPQLLITSIHDLTSSSSRFMTKSKNERPRTSVVLMILSFEQYIMLQLTENRFRMSAVRTDCSGRGSKRMGDALCGVEPEGEPGRGIISSGGTGHGGMGLGSFQR